MEITKMTVKSLSDAIISREISSVEATRAYLDRIKEKDSDIGAYLTVTAEKALNAQKETVLWMISFFPPEASTSGTANTTP